MIAAKVCEESSGICRHTTCTHSIFRMCAKDLTSPCHWGSLGKLVAVQDYKHFLANGDEPACYILFLDFGIALLHSAVLLFL